MLMLNKSCFHLLLPGAEGEQGSEAVRTSGMKGPSFCPPVPGEV